MKRDETVAAIRVSLEDLIACKHAGATAPQHCMAAPNLVAARIAMIHWTEGDHTVALRWAALRWAEKSLGELVDRYITELANAGISAPRVQ